MREELPIALFVEFDEEFLNVRIDYELYGGL